ncbi:MAG TPA: hypothetical protein VF933_10595 [Streptosporangiaceae bacterium]
MSGWRLAGGRPPWAAGLGTGLRAWWRRSTVRLAATSGLLGAACVAWAAAPAGPAGRAAPTLTVLAACCVAGGLAQLATAALVPPGAAAYPGPLTRVGLRGLDWLRRLPWAEGVLLGTLVLEALHPVRPWHTAVLGVALIAYLLATHLAESADGRGEAAAVLRGQAPVLAAGLGLLVLAAASALLPSAGTGLAGSWLRAAAAAAAVLACALALPV